MYLYNFTLDDCEPLPAREPLPVPPGRSIVNHAAIIIACSQLKKKFPHELILRILHQFFKLGPLKITEIGELPARGTPIQIKIFAMNYNIFRVMGRFY